MVVTLKTQHLKILGVNLFMPMIILSIPHELKNNRQ